MMTVRMALCGLPHWLGCLPKYESSSETAPSGAAKGHVFRVWSVGRWGDVMHADFYESDVCTSCLVAGYITRNMHEMVEYEEVLA